MLNLHCIWRMSKVYTLGRYGMDCPSGPTPLLCSKIRHFCVVTITVLMPLN